MTVEVGATDDEHLLCTPRQDERAPVEQPEVTRVEPAAAGQALRVGGGVVVVAAHDACSTNLQPAHLQLLERHKAGALLRSRHDPDLDARRRRAERHERRRGQRRVGARRSARRPACVRCRRRHELARARAEAGLEHVHGRVGPGVFPSVRHARGRLCHSKGGHHHGRRQPREGQEGIACLGRHLLARIHQLAHACEITHGLEGRRTTGSQRRRHQLKAKIGRPRVRDAVRRHRAQPNQGIGHDFVGRDLNGAAAEVHVGQVAREQRHHVVKGKPIEARLLGRRLRGALTCTQSGPSGGSRVISRVISRLADVRDDGTVRLWNHLWHARRA